MSVRVCGLLKNRTSFFSRSFVRFVNTSESKVYPKEIEEIQIPVPWGYLAGKWWGDKGVTPVVALHGWQDNANSFDNLIPLINVPSVLAIDLPGHGLSSHFPEGFPYDFGENIMALHRVRRYYNWEKMPLIAHSFGAVLAYAYTAMFPNDVKCLISLECIRSVLALFKQECCIAMSAALDDFLKIERQKKSDNKPSYKLSHLMHMCVEGSMGSIICPQAALTLLSRVTLPSNSASQAKSKISSDLEKFILAEKAVSSSWPKEEREPIDRYISSLKATLAEARENLKNFNLDESKNQYFTLMRDPSTRVLIFHPFDKDTVLLAARNIKPPVLAIRSASGFLHGTGKKLYDKSMEIIKKNSAYSEHHDIEGTHHIHLVRPEEVAKLINNFIDKL